MHLNLIKIKKYIIIFSVFCFLFSAVFIFGQMVLAQYGLDETLEAVDAKDALKANENIPTAVGKIVGALLSFIGVLFFILMIYGGFLWMTAQGNEEQVGKAKNLITAAVIGLIIVMSAYAITAYIGGTVTRSSTTSYY